MQNNYTGRLILAPHPDDEILCCSSILKDSKVIIVTSGDLGTGGLRDSMTESEYCLAREEESKRACAEYGVISVEFLRLKEKELNSGDIGIDLTPLVRGATQLFCTHPKDEHIGHKALADIVTVISNRLGIDLYYYGHKKFEDYPNIINELDVDQYLKKISAIKQFKTQVHWLIQHIEGKADVYKIERFYASPNTIKGVFHDRNGKSFSPRPRRDNNETNQRYPRDRKYNRRY